MTSQRGKGGRQGREIGESGPAEQSVGAGGGRKQYRSSGRTGGPFPNALRVGRSLYSTRPTLAPTVRQPPGECLPPTPQKGTSSRRKVAKRRSTLASDPARRCRSPFAPPLRRISAPLAPQPIVTRFCALGSWHAARVVALASPRVDCAFCAVYPYVRYDQAHGRGLWVGCRGLQLLRWGYLWRW